MTKHIQALGETLDFDISTMFIDSDGSSDIRIDREYNIAVAGTGYVGLSLAVLLSQHNRVTVVDIIPEKVEKIGNLISPIQDDYIETFLSEEREGKRNLKLNATLDGKAAYSTADFIIIAVPTNYDPKRQFFDCSAVENVLNLIKELCINY